MEQSATAIIEGVAAEPEERALREALTRAGFEPVEIAHRPEERAQWGAYLPESWWLVVLLVALSPFFQRLQEEAASDAWRRLKRLIGDVWDSWKRVPLPGRVVLQERPSGLSVVFGDRDLPDEAYQGVLELDPDEAGRYVWDTFRRTWRREDG